MFFAAFGVKKQMVGEKNDETIGGLHVALPRPAHTQGSANTTPVCRAGRNALSCAKRPKKAARVPHGKHIFFHVVRGNAGTYGDKVMIPWHGLVQATSIGRSDGRVPSAEGERAKATRRSARAFRERNKHETVLRNLGAKA